ncbi:hypothetical protein EBR03_10430 [bacterium]|nr:hypothetical protein [bacterium]
MRYEVGSINPPPLRLSAKLILLVLFSLFGFLFFKLYQENHFPKDYDSKEFHDELVLARSGLRLTGEGISERRAAIFDHEIYLLKETAEGEKKEIRKLLGEFERLSISVALSDELDEACKRLKELSVVVKVLSRNDKASSLFGGLKYKYPMTRGEAILNFHFSNLTQKLKDRGESCGHW